MAESSSTRSSETPLLEPWQLPPFDRIDPGTVPAALDAVLAENERTLAAVAAAGAARLAAPTARGNTEADNGLDGAAADDGADQVADVVTDDTAWARIIEPLEEASDRIARLWSPIRHLHAVSDSPTLREVYDQGLPKLTAYYSSFGQNAGLFAAYRALAASPAFADFEPARRMAVEQALRDFRLTGIDLDPPAQARYREISQRLSELSNRFSQNLLDATDSWSLTVGEEQLAGLPESTCERAREEGRQRETDGAVLLLDGPTYLAVLTHADDRALRRALYTAWTTRASDPALAVAASADESVEGSVAGSARASADAAARESGRVDAGRDSGEQESAGQDNALLIKEILALRHEQAQLLGHGSHAARALMTRMAGSPEDVLTFLDDLVRRVRPQALAEFAELEAYARDALGLEALRAWDVPWVAERLRRERYEVSQETLRPWFPVDRVIAGMFEVVRRLFDIDVLEQHDWPTWHEDVRCFEVRRAGEVLGRFYLDLFARRHKRGGAWMDGCLGRRRTASGVQTPVAFLTCNFGGPVGDRPALLTHEEVTTLFHEFGHGLHHMLTQVDVADVAGINGVPWDAVELPSQFLENWCWHPEGIALISGHWETGESLPRELLDRLLSARNFQSATMMVRQLELATFDFRLHHEYRPGDPDIVRRILGEVRDAVSVVPVPDFNRFENGFAHIFSGGYAAGYYSYLWAEVLSADAFSRFEDEGVFNAQVGQAFLENVLERGGSEPPSELFRRFRGRNPDSAALLRHRGISGDGVNDQ